MEIKGIPNPCYIIDTDLLSHNLSVISRVSEKAQVEIIMAFKAFAMWGTFPLFRPFLTSTAASSLNEARLAAEEMHTLAHTYAVAYCEEDFDAICRFSSHITFNSIAQYERFLPYVLQHYPQISMGLRINPEFSEVSTALYNPCKEGSRLGVARSYLSDLPSHIEGLHVHALCESSVEDTENLLRCVSEKFHPLLQKMRWINLGGGHLMTRKGYDVDRLIVALNDFRAKYPQLHVILEPGSAFTWETGVLLARVEDVVTHHDIQTAILNVSFTAHMPDCLEMPYQPRIMGAVQIQDHQPREGFPYVYRMGGNSCLSGDYMGDWGFDHPLQVGEPLFFEDMIHYTMVKTTLFNGVAHPSIGSWNEKDGFHLIKKFDYQDYKSKLS